LPLVVTAVDGNLQQVRDGVEGLLVPPDDPAALADAMLRFCRDAELRSRCAAAAAARARREFTWEAMVDRYEALYASVANRPGEGR
jgi:glycosyltransferase involved in cell wall biosynthesis